MSAAAASFASPDGREEEWLALRLALWPMDSSQEHRVGMADARARGHFVRLAIVQAIAVGFIEASVRKDYVNGTRSSPVGFVEGIFVADAHRRRGLAGMLVELAAAWAHEQGCQELASDCLLDNEAAHAVHRAIGFEETERVIYFRRPL